MTDKALKGNKLTKKFNLNLTSLETPKHIKDKKRWAIKYTTALNRMHRQRRGKK